MPDDKHPRVTCATCAHYRAGYCTNARLAQLEHHNSRAEIGRDLAALPQHCPAHKGKK